MKLIFDESSCKTESDLLRKFESIYENGFPDSNERELFQDIINRVVGDKKPDEPHSIIVLKNADENNGEVYGGLIADWYEKSKAIHLTYLIIDNQFRGKGIANILINDGVNLIKDWIKNYRHIEIRNVFFESNNPELTENDNFNPYKRLEIFSKLGAKWINIPYIQPALDSKKDDVNNLLLLTFPQFNADKSKIPVSEITAFLTEFYAGLGGKRESLNKMIDSLHQVENRDGFIEPESILESNHYKYSNAAVTMHFIEENSEWIGSQQDDKYNYLASFESDMLNFRNQILQKKDFISSYAGNHKATLLFPQAYEYWSEGIRHYKITDSDRIKVPVILSVNKTFVEKSKITVWHLSITPDNNSTLTENDLIKLAHKFGSDQEKAKFYTDLSLEINNEKEPNEMVERVTKLFNSEKSHEKSGIIQIDSSQFFNSKAEWLDFLDLFLKERNAIENKDFKKISKTLCGIILGIFDFERMNEDEIFDTIQPVSTKSETLIISCRGTLLKIKYNEEVCNAINNHIIADPYLLVPNMVLIHNTHILNQIFKKISDTMDPRQKYKLDFLEKSQREIRNTLSVKLIHDVFQYPSEKEIIKTGEVQRGIISLNYEINKLLNDLSELILIKRGNKSINSDAIVSAFLAFISLFQLTGIITEFDSVSLPILIIFGCELLLAFGIYWKLSSKRIRGS